MKYQTVLFDLDGTLLDTKPGIIKAFCHVIPTFGFPAPAEKDYDLLLGPPLKNCFTDVCKMDEATAEEAVTRYREYLIESGNVFNCRVFDGMAPLLKKLRDEGFHLGVASSKARFLCEKILHEKGIDRYFDAIVGPEAGNMASTKAQMIAEALEKMHAPSPAVIIGDRKFDAEGAKLAGIDSIGVLYGYGAEEEIRSAGFTQIAAGVSDIYPLLAG